MTESRSAECKNTPPIGVPVVAVGGGASCGVATICVRRSGDAPSRNQTRPSGENANWVCVRVVALSVPARSPVQLRQPQFHCGKPPPAADPRILMCMEAESVIVWTGRAGSLSGQCI